MTLDDQRDFGTVQLRAGVDAPDTQSLRAVTEAGATASFDLGTGEVRSVTLPEGESRWLRIEASGQATGLQVRIAEVEVPGVAPRKELVLPTVPDAWGSPAAVLLEAALDARSGCVDVELTVRCQVGRERSGEEETGFARRFSLPEDATYDTRFWVRPSRGRPGRGGAAARLPGVGHLDQPGRPGRPSIGIRRARRRRRHHLARVAQRRRPHA